MFDGLLVDCPNFIENDDKERADVGVVVGVVGGLDKNAASGLVAVVVG